jgi:AcrR family transcriptional regulator
LSADAEAATGDPRYERIVTAASALLGERGYSSISTLDIANAARVSKRELYRLFENKEGIIEACVARRAARLRIPLVDTPPTDPDTLVASLTGFGVAVLRELSDPTVLALYRLAVTQSEQAPHLAAAVDRSGRQVIREALTRLLERAQASEAIGPGDPSTMAGEFFGLLWGDLLVRLILAVAQRPTPHECRRRVRVAVDALQRLYPPAPMPRVPVHSSGSGTHAFSGGS